MHAMLVWEFLRIVEIQEASFSIQQDPRHGRLIRKISLAWMKLKDILERDNMVGSASLNTYVCANILRL